MHSVWVTIPYYGPCKMAIIQLQSRFRPWKRQYYEKQFLPAYWTAFRAQNAWFVVVSYVSLLYFEKFDALIWCTFITKECSQLLHDDFLLIETSGQILCPKILTGASKFISYWNIFKNDKNLIRQTMIRSYRF